MRRILPLLLFLASARSEATMLQVPRPELCAQAALVVLAEVTGSETRWTEDSPGGLETRWDLAVLRVVKGQAPSDSLVLRTPGGAAAGIRLQVSIAPELAVDHRYLLMLTPVEGGYRVTGEAQGVIPLRHGQGAGEDEAAALLSLEPCRVD